MITKTKKLHIFILSATTPEITEADVATKTT